MGQAIKLDDRKLWGNAAAEFERLDVLASYFVSQNSFSDFFDADEPFLIARAPKGMGKSALIRECEHLRREEDDAIVIFAKGSDLVAQRPLAQLTRHEHIYDWQQRICMLINKHIGSRINLAFSDDQMLLVETAELAGYRSRNLVSALVERLGGKLGDWGKMTKAHAPDQRALLGRTPKKVWLLIDDIDAMFISTPEEQLRISSFLAACAELAIGFEGVNIRTTIRADVWPCIRRTDQALDRLEQYMTDIRWSNSLLGEMLAERIKSYCRRELNEATPLDGKEAIRRIFPARFPLGQSKVQPHRFLYVYSAGRPRWATELCRLAGREAEKHRSTVIRHTHIRQVLEEYGRFRWSDLVAEHQHQCPEIAEIINAFSRKQAHYNTDELFAFLDAQVMSNVEINIETARAGSAREVARFLFRIGFLLGVDAGEGKPRYFGFEDRPDLLTSQTNVDDGLSWNIHPVFRGAIVLD
ncbi:MAG: hypothetical protein K0U93_30355 [Gammaproteobacteria bacterium]|nr:hypothetical protein [Gammaproteobacteria bacterium]